jgi:hypothetical protein
MNLIPIVSSLLMITIRIEGIERKERTEEAEEEELDNKILKSVAPWCSRALAYKLPKRAANSTTGPVYASTPHGPKSISTLNHWCHLVANKKVQDLLVFVINLASVLPFWGKLTLGFTVWGNFLGFA